MRSAAAVLASLLVLALAASPALALTTIPTATDSIQEVWVQQGASTTIPLLLSASSGDTGKRISADGEQKSWVIFSNGKDFFDLANEGQIPLPVTFTVPTDAKIDAVTIKLLLGTDTFYTFKVNVVLKPEDIRGLQAKAQTGDQIAALNEQLTAQVTTLTTTISELQANTQISLDKALQAQAQVTDLSSKKATIQAQLDAANSQLTELRAEKERLSTQNEQLRVTGNLIGGASPVTFGAGLLIGAGALYLLFGRRWGWVHKSKPAAPQRPL